MRLTQAALVFSMAVAGCVGPSADPRFVQVYQPVPPLLVETRPLPPVSREQLIWRPGHWVWNGAGYAWDPGAYEPRGVHPDRWVHGNWRKEPAGYLWEPAHWG